jgi:hypothetical protein
LFRLESKEAFVFGCVMSAKAVILHTSQRG